MNYWKRIVVRFVRSRIHGDLTPACVNFFIVFVDGTNIYTHIYIYTRYNKNNKIIHFHRGRTMMYTRRLDAYFANRQDYDIVNLPE